MVMMMPSVNDDARRRTSSMLHVNFVVLTANLLLFSEFAQGKLQCACTTPECQRDGTTACQSENVCYVQLIPPVSSSLPMSASGRRRPGDVTRGCIDDDTPLLCENKRPTTYRGAWPVLHCCSDDDWCNRDLLPTLPAWAHQVEEEGDTRDSRPLTKPVSPRPWSVVPPPPTQSSSLAGHETRQNFDHDDGRLFNPLYVGVPAACACVLLALVVLGVLLVRYGRERRADDRRDKAAALLPSYRARTVAAAVVGLPPSPLGHRPIVGFPPSREPCICLHCNRPIYVPPSTTYSLVETPS